MSWFFKFIDSSIGKKLVMALTGLFLSLFLIEHLAGNLLLLTGPKAFSEYSGYMGNTENLIQVLVRIIEVGLFLLMFYHAINGVRLWFSNNSARGSKSYSKNNPSANSSFFSRFMIQSGSIIFIFLVIHLRTFFFEYRILKEGGHDEYAMYNGAVQAFQNPVYSGFYLFAFVLLAFHLIHGVQSSFQTLGVRNKYTPFLKGFGIAFSIIICAGFAIIPIFFLAGGGK